MNISIIKNNKLNYNILPPFNANSLFPEYPFGNNNIDKKNHIYTCIRKALNSLGMDSNNFNTKEWNPLGEIIIPGNTVLIKPNMVSHYSPLGTDQLVTHGSIIRALLDYTYIALKGAGTIIIGDAPVQGTNFVKTVKLMGIDKIIDFYDKNTTTKIRLVDFRTEKTKKIN